MLNGKSNICSCRTDVMVFESVFEKQCQDVEAPPELSFTTASLSILLILTNIPGNILIILAVVLDPNKNLRTPFNWLLVNLATADLIVGFITQPISAYYHIKEGLRLHRSPQEVKTHHMAYFISCTASVLSLTSLAVERYLAVRKPNAYRTNVNNKRIAATVAIIWLISLSLPQIYLEVGFTMYGFIFANSSIVIAVSFICITYALMKQKFKPPPGRCSSDIANKNSTSVANHGDELRENDDQRVGSIAAKANQIQMESRDEVRNANTNLSSSNAAFKRRQLLENKVNKMFLVVIIALLCCYGPSTIMMYFVNFCESCSCATLHWFRDIHFVLTLANSSVNVFCYALRSSKFRNAFAKFCKIKRSRDAKDADIQHQIVEKNFRKIM